MRKIMSLAICVHLVAFAGQEYPAQTSQVTGQDLTIKRKTTAKMPEEIAGMVRTAEGRSVPDSMTSTYYFKDGRMRSEQTTKEYNFIGIPKKRSEVEIRLCAKKETLFFNSKEKKYWSVPFTAE